jgi:hypothetical protein
MILLVLIPFAFCNKEIYTDENLYSEKQTMDHIKEVYANLQEDYIIYNNGETPISYSKQKMRENTKQWIETVESSITRQKFLVWVMDLPHTMTFRAHDLLYLDHTPEISHCLVFGLYNSEDYPHMTTKQQHALKSFLVGTNEVFLERCAFATVDVSYPPNKLIFGDYATPDAPAIIFKNPVLNTSSENHMIYRKKDDYDNIYFQFNPQFTKWGSFKPFKELKSDIILATLDLLHKYSTLSTQTLIAQAIYQPQYTYNMGDGIVFHNVSSVIRQNYFNKIWNNIQDTEMAKCKSNQMCTDEEIKIENKKLLHFTSKTLFNIWADLNLEAEIETDQIQKLIKTFGRDTIRIKPRKLPDISALFTQWSKYFSGDRDEL